MRAVMPSISKPPSIARASPTVGGAHLDPVAPDLLDAARPQLGGGEAVVAEHAVHGAGGVVARLAGVQHERAPAGAPEGQRGAQARGPGADDDAIEVHALQACAPTPELARYSCRNGKYRRTGPRTPEGAARRARPQPGGGRRAGGHGGLDAQPARVRRPPPGARPPDAAGRARSASRSATCSRPPPSDPRVREQLAHRRGHRHPPALPPRARRPDRRPHGLPRGAHDPRTRAATRATSGSTCLAAGCGSCSATTTWSSSRARRPSSRPGRRTGWARSTAPRRRSRSSARRANACISAPKGVRPFSAGTTTGVLVGREGSMSSTPEGSRGGGGGCRGAREVGSRSGRRRGTATTIAWWGPPRDVRRTLDQVDARSLQRYDHALVGLRHAPHAVRRRPIRSAGSARRATTSRTSSTRSPQTSGGRMTVELQSYVQPPARGSRSPTTISNVVATLKGTDPASADRVYVVGAPLRLARHRRPERHRRRARRQRRRLRHVRGARAGAGAGAAARPRRRSSSSPTPARSRACTAPTTSPRSPSRTAGTSRAS